MEAATGDVRKRNRSGGERGERFPAYWVVDFSPVESKGNWAPKLCHSGFQMLRQSAMGEDGPWTPGPGKRAGSRRET
jgi:hypothetical protein